MRPQPHQFSAGLYPAPRACCNLLRTRPDCRVIECDHESSRRFRIHSLPDGWRINPVDWRTPHGIPASHPVLFLSVLQPGVCLHRASPDRRWTGGFVQQRGAGREMETTCRLRSRTADQDRTGCSRNPETKQRRHPWTRPVTDESPRRKDTPLL